MIVEFLSSLSRWPAKIAWPSYDRAKTRAGIVHIGPGAFHRAHQAPAFEALLRTDSRWGIIGVSLHSPDVRDALAPQEGLYTLALLDEEVSFRVIGSIKEVIVASENPEAALAALTSPETELVTLTVTEKGYCLDASGQLDTLHPDIKADTATPTHPRSTPGYLAEALFRRFRAGRRPFVLLSCDNLVDNGRKLSAAVSALARAQEREAEFLLWLSHKLASPRTMVDSITPATDDALRERVEKALGVRDRWPVQREAFTQWVIERDPRLPDLDWEAAGVTLADDVSAYERAKLRILNASHSSLAYQGLLRGQETVAQAIADPELAAFVRGLMEEDVSPGLSLPDLPAYREAVLKRFRNPEIKHYLLQIAWDGSQKLPNRLFGLIDEAMKAGRPVARPARTVAAWFLFLRKKAVNPADKLVDPLAPLLLDTAARANGDAAHDVPLFLALDAVFPPALAANETFRRTLIEAYRELSR